MPHHSPSRHGEKPISTAAIESGVSGHTGGGAEYASSIQAVRDGELEKGMLLPCS